MRTAIIGPDPQVKLTPTISLGLSREEKSLRHVAMVAKFWEDNKPIKSLKSLFALFQTSPVFFSFI